MVFDRYCMSRMMYNEQTLVYYVVFVVVDGVLMKKETKVTMELNQIYRWNFDTRLGMWSPA